MQFVYSRYTYIVLAVQVSDFSDIGVRCNSSLLISVNLMVQWQLKAILFSPPVVKVPSTDLAALLGYNQR